VVAVDDEPQVLRYVRRTLEEAGYEVTSAADPDEAVKQVELQEPDIILLDLRLQGRSGLDLLKRIREFSGVPAIFLTAETQSEDAVRALRAGADDYVTKPFAPTELVARIEAALRRRLLPDQVEARQPYRLGALEINFAERRVTVEGKPVTLSATEYKLLYQLATNAGRVVTHDQILKSVWGPEYEGEHELIRSFIRNLRRKLGDDVKSARYVLTEPQVGYRMPKPDA
jgi:two-component system KDP operon response regulator KdpE